jgi:signal transduction histidine kinase
MSRDARTRRPARPIRGVSPRRGGVAATATPLISLLTHSTRLRDVLPALHQRALDVTGGSCSLLFEQNPRTAVMRATSAYPLRGRLASELWIPGPDESARLAESFGRRQPTLVTNLEVEMPDLARRLRSPAALLFPLMRGRKRAGLLAVGFAEPPPLGALHGDAAEMTDGFLTTLELFRCRDNEMRSRRRRELVDELAAGLASMSNMAAALERLCVGANQLFGARRTAVWLHDRPTRQVLRVAASDAADDVRSVASSETLNDALNDAPPTRERPRTDTAVSADNTSNPAVAAMRSERAAILLSPRDAATSTITVPLRGCRRALGAMIFERVRTEPGGELDLLDAATQLGREIATAIENTQLLDDLIRSRRELENTFDSIAQLVVVADRDGRIVRANDAFASRLKSTRAALVNKPLVECVGAELLAWLMELEEAGPRPEGQPPPSREVHDSVLNGPFMVTVTDLVDHNRQRVGRVIVARDLTPRSRLEAEREELRDRLTQSDKLAALGQFVAGIAHELNNPLQGVLGHLELLRVTGAFPKHLRREVQTIYREADRAARIVRNLLVFAGSRRLARRNVSLNAVLHKIMVLRQDACRAQQIELVRHYNEKLPRVKSDPLLLHQVFFNMMMNAEQAIAATGKPGRIEIRTTMSAYGDRIIATVRDSGRGIPPDSLTRIFEPFYSTKEVGKGTGLGLAIAYGIVQEHGGQIAAANHPDGGAVFTVELPIGSPQ